MVTIVDNSIFTKAANFVSSLMSGNDGSHDWEHVRRVWRIALDIAHKEASTLSPSEAQRLIDLNLIQLAAIFHDVADVKYQNAIENIQTVSDVVARFVAQETQLPDLLVDDIVYVVENMSFRKELGKGLSAYFDASRPRDYALAIVQDADRLEAMGAIGTARCFAFAGARKSAFYPPPSAQGTSIAHRVVSEFTAEEYDSQLRQGGSTALGHFYEKLFKLKDAMKTQTAKQMAEERHKFMQQFVLQFRRECFLD
jgi:uncharacterized protein